MVDACWCSAAVTLSETLWVTPTPSVTLSVTPSVTPSSAVTLAGHGVLHAGHGVVSP